MSELTGAELWVRNEDEWHEGEVTTEFEDGLDAPKYRPDGYYKTTCRNLFGISGDW